MQTNARTMQGVVTSNKMDNTIVVRIERWVRHALYGKIMKKFTKIKAHDAENTCNIGDVVKIQECRPISKSKAWTLVNVLERAR